jgi:peptidoglycan/xylan/chitin deacetylase (PgdA/CDA1 family)
MPSPHTLRERIGHKLAKSFPMRRADFAPERPIVSFCFDDVPASALEGACVLERYGVHGTFYATGGVSGGQFDGHTILSEADYRDLRQRGHEIGHHTFTHRTPVALGRDYAKDLAQNDAYLNAILGAPVRNFAFPYGRSSRAAQKLVTRRFRSSRGVENGVNRRGSDLDLLRAVGIGGDMTLATLTTWIDDAVAAPGWLIYFTHDVQERPSDYGTTPAILDGLVGAALAGGAEVLTVDAALDRLGVAQ